MKNNKKDVPGKRDNWQESFTHQKTPKRVAPRLGAKQKNAGIKPKKK